ncbi:unnamed protein product [Allacma fusca]|uniref:ODAD1 central coiled coil region domain-containing protein n=1 Tax=Allacma fusca TaxID=39272 RepID=A0A8J2KF64_9HEXA|nr:unnamed protein product [Allacma fusca]
MDFDGDDGMTSGIPIHANESEVDLKLVAQREYQRLKRQYFLMQKNRQSLMEKAGSKMARSQKLVRVLEEQRDNLELNLTAATSANNQKKDEVTKEKIWKLLQVYEKYKSQVEKLTAEINSMEKTVIKMTAKFYKAKLHIQAVLGVATPISRVERNIENNEKKLHIIKSNYDSLMTENSALKDEIGTKINRRFAIFNRMDQLHRKMTECRRDLNNSVDTALQVYNVWDDAARKITFIKDKYKEEVRQHLLEMKEYDRLLFHDIREIQFYSTKNKPRQLLEEAMDKEARKNEREEDALRKDLRRYQRHFSRLEEFDSNQDVDMIISNYKSLEQKNFAYFQQMSDMSKENENLMDEIHDLKTELEEIHVLKEAEDKKKAEQLLRLELTRDLESDKLSQMKAQLDATDDATGKMLAAIEAFFQAAECDTEPLQELLGDNEHITCNNLRAAFNLLEHHIAEIQLEKQLLKIQKDTEIHSAPSVTKPPKIHKSSGGPFEPTLVISGRPELGMEKKDDEEDNLFTVAPISKAVQKEHIIAQLRDLGVIASPKQVGSSPSESKSSVLSKSGKSATSDKPEYTTETEDEREETDDGLSGPSPGTISGPDTDATDEGPE